MLEALDHKWFYLAYGAGGHPLVLWTMIALSWLGSGWAIVMMVPMLVARRTRPFARSLTIVLGVTAIAVTLLKASVRRVRPCGLLSDVHSLFFTAPTDPSCPSGHAAGSFAFVAFVVAFLARTSLPRRARLFASIFLIAIATGIAFSRVYLGVHFPFDVLAGAVLGTVIGVAGARVHVRTSSADASIRDPRPKTP